MFVMDSFLFFEKDQFFKKKMVFWKTEFFKKNKKNEKPDKRKTMINIT
jgi:hypothetical protein